MTALIVNITGVVLIVCIVWWFLIKKPKGAKVTSNSIDILVENGVYEPSIVRTKAGQTLQVNFLRRDKSPCAEYVVFDDFDISAKLPINEKHTVTLNLEKPGEYEFTCQMGMYRGKVIVT